VFEGPSIYPLYFVADISYRQGDLLYMQGDIIRSITNNKNSKDIFQGNDRTVVGSVTENSVGIRLQVAWNSAGINVTVTLLAHIAWS
jgi:ABC-type maltose transport system permease subunit